MLQAGAAEVELRLAAGEAAGVSGSAAGRAATVESESAAGEAAGVGCSTAGRSSRSRFKV